MTSTEKVESATEVAEPVTIEDLPEGASPTLSREEEEHVQGGLEGTRSSGRRKPRHPNLGRRLN